MKITFRQLDVFRTVVSTGTVTETAKILGISQPAVSRLLADLQEEIGFELFGRSGRNLKPTPEARLLVEEVRRSLTGLEQIKDVARSIKSFKHARLRLITSPFFSVAVVPGIIKKFSQRHPEAMISLEIQSADDSVEWMVSQYYDFGITTPTIKTPTFMSHSLVKTDALCIVPTGHRLENKRVIRPKDLSGEQFISYFADSVFRFEIDEVFRKAKIDRNLQYEARTTAAICRLVSQGLGVSIIGHVFGDNEVQTGFKAIRFDSSISYKAALIWSKQRTMSAIAKDFLEMIKEDSLGK